MKKVLFVINTLGRAGAERALISLIKVLPKDEFKIDFFSVIGRGELFDEIPPHVNIINKSYSNASNLDKEGIEFITKTVLKSLVRNGYFVKYTPYFFQNIFLQLKNKRILFDKLFWMALADNAPRQETEYDLVIAYTEGASTYYVSKYVNAKKKAAFVHVDYLKAGYMPQLDKQYYDNMDAIYCVSDLVMHGFLQVYPEYKHKTAVFHNVILSDEVIDKSKAGMGFEDDFDGIRLLTAGRLHYQKAYDIAIPAFAKLLAMGCKNVRWYVLGNGPEKASLEQLVEQLDLQGKFVFLGIKENPYPYMAQCDIYVQASRFEGWCIALAEALLLNRPTLVTDFAGSDEQIINGKTGLIINLDEDEIASTIKRMIENVKLRETFSNNLKTREIDYLRDLKQFYALLEDDS